MKYILLSCLFLVGCANPKYCGVETYQYGVVTYEPNPNIMHNEYHDQYGGEYYCQGFYEPIMLSPPFGPKGWVKGLGYKYND
jgi:hypothetical protein